MAKHPKADPAHDSAPQTEEPHMESEETFPIAEPEPPVVVTTVVATAEPEAVPAPPPAEPPSAQPGPADPADAAFEALRAAIAPHVRAIRDALAAVGYHALDGIARGHIGAAVTHLSAIVPNEE